MSSPPLIDSQVWRSCTGVSTTIPAAGSLVYYFPQGHAEQAFSSPEFSSVSGEIRPFFVCRVAGVRLLANDETDEVFASITLDPRVSQHRVVSPEISVEDPEEGSGGVRFFAKTLTQSDANNGGGFSVPRICAENVFPKLDTSGDGVANHPAQDLTMIDMHGKDWGFKHIYRGSPRRHLLTTGWSKFVNSKKLIHGDTVIFVRDRDGGLFVGIRRGLRSIPYVSPAAGDNLDERSFMEKGGWRSVKGRVSAEAVVESVRRAESGVCFEVVCYPRFGSPDFVVPVNVVDKAMCFPWVVGGRVRMAKEAEDSSKTEWFQGTVSGMALSDQLIWKNSPWQALQVTWDGPDAQKLIKSVNPWHVDFVSAAIPQLQGQYPDVKRIRISKPPDLCGSNDSFLPMTVVGGAPSLFRSTSVPAGMQGARHDYSIGVPSLLDFMGPATCQIDPFSFRNGDTQIDPDDVSTELSIIDSSWSGSSSPHSQSTPRAESYKGAVSSSGSFRLLGRAIELVPTSNATDDVANLDDASKECNKAEDAEQHDDLSPLKWKLSLE